MFWTAQHVFGFQQPLVYTGSGSGDKIFDWVQAFCLLTMALAGACLWSAADRRRGHYANLYKWFRVFLRFALAGQMFVYGLIKVIPMQMPFPSLAQLLQPLGSFSPMGVLWSSIGAAPAYERFVGSAELTAGLLLVVPATSMLGALLCMIDMTEVFVLNMSYDVPVKLLSFHLMLIAAFLLLPERSRLARFCFCDCAVGPPVTRKLFEQGLKNRFVTAAQILFGLLLLVTNVYSAQRNWHKWGGGARKLPLYGIWNVDEMAIDGTVRLPLLTDYDRWRRVIFEFPQAATFERVDDSFAWFGINLDVKRNSLALTKNSDRNWRGQLTVHRQDTDHMILEGQMGPQKVHMQMSRMDPSRFLLIGRGFHWIQDYPFNR